MKEYEISHLADELSQEVAHGREVMEEIGQKTVCLFGGARVKPEQPAYQGAYETARLLSQHGISVVTGGGPGIMEAGNKGAKAGKNGKSIGLNIELPFEQKGNAYQDVSLNFAHFASRKVTFCRNASGFVFFAGGFGTLDELGEVLTLIQTGKSDRVPVILYGVDFWKGMLDWMQATMLAQGLLAQTDLDRLILVDTPEEAVTALNLFAEAVAA